MMLTKMATAAAPREVSPGSRRFRGVASTHELDRDHDRILAWDLAEYAKNPTLLWNHDLSEPIGKVTELSERGGCLEVTFELLPEGVSEAADFVYEALLHGTVRALSIGFSARGAKPNGEGGYDIQTATMHELSVVPVPANAGALAAALGGKRVRVFHEPDRPRPVTKARIEAAVNEYVRREARAFISFHSGRLD